MGTRQNFGIPPRKCPAAMDATGPARLFHVAAPASVDFAIFHSPRTDLSSSHPDLDHVDMAVEMHALALWAPSRRAPIFQRGYLFAVPGAPYCPPPVRSEKPRMDSRRSRYSHISDNCCRRVSRGMRDSGLASTSNARARHPRPRPACLTGRRCILFSCLRNQHALPHYGINTV